MIARTCSGTMARDRTRPCGVTARVHLAPPSVVSHSPSPNTNPCSGVAKRMPHTPPGCPGAPMGTAGAGRPVQLAPRFSVRAIEVHGACAHGAVPSTNASSGDTHVTDVAANPAGTPPAGRPSVGPVPGGGNDFEAERPGVLAPAFAERAAAGSCTVPHPATPMTAATASTAVHRGARMPTISLAVYAPRRRGGGSVGPRFRTARARRARRPRCGRGSRGTARSSARPGTAGPPRPAGPRPSSP